MLKQTIRRGATFMKLCSSKGKPGAAVLAVALAAAWLVDLVWLVVSIYLWNVSPLSAAIISCSTVAFGIYLAIATGRLYRKMVRSFQLIADDDCISVISCDNGCERIQSMRWAAIALAEWYRNRDEASIVLRGVDEFVEIPLWAFSNRTSDILALIEKNRVSMFLVP